METLILYNIHKFRKDGNIVIVDQDVDISGRNLVKIPFKIDILNGNFDIRGNPIENMYNSPSVINGNLIASNCKLTSLDNFPLVSKNIFLDGNNLHTLKGIITSVKHLRISRNPLDTLSYAPLIENYKEWKFECINTKINLVELKIFKKCQTLAIWNPKLSIYENMKLLKDPLLEIEYRKFLSEKFGI